LCVLVPNRRSGLFFTTYLKKHLSHPLIGPCITTISEWMLSLPELYPADRLQLISALYEVYRKQTGTSESFDDFYFWGDVLLSDFDDIDKYLVNASDLFRNLLSLKDIEQQFDYLTDDQKKVILQFWGSLRSWEIFEHERSFVSVWEKLYGIYATFRERIMGKGIGYPGLIMREGIASLTSGKAGLKYGTYAVIGLNALNACEKEAFTFLKQSGKALFLWDYDDYYVSNKANNAGKFLRENLLLFPAPEDFRLETGNFGKDKNMEIVAVPSQTGQSQVIPGCLEKSGTRGSSAFDSTAIVLADESLLFPVLGAIPAEAGPINVTMGYPVKNSPVVSLLFLISALIRHADVSVVNTRGLYHKPVLDILSHQLLKEIEPEKTALLIKEVNIRNRIYLQPEELDLSPIHRRIFALPADVSEYNSYFMEIIRLLVGITCQGPENRMLKETFYAVYLALEKLDAIVGDTQGSVPSGLTPAVFFRLMMQHLNQVSVPFEGEPLSGIQVMGILETRCLDFDNLIIIGLNEDTWPRTGTGPSMIPYNIRKGFGLPGIDDQDAMYAYYFYRLIQRAENITATWNTVREATSGGELSRFGFQLLLNSPHMVKKTNFDYPFLKNTPRPFSIPSSPAIAGRLLEIYQTEKALSPSAISSFLHCRLQFYFRYVVGLREEEEVKEEIDRMAFGNIFHKAVEMIYHPYEEKMMEKSDFQKIHSDSILIKNVTLRAISSEFFRTDPDKVGQLKLEGKSMLMKSTIETYIRNLLEYDMGKAPFYIHALEKVLETVVETEIDQVNRKIRIGGKADRLDESGGVLRIVDYKTGSLNSSDLLFKSFEELFDVTKLKIKKELIQALIYAYIFHKVTHLEKPVQASVYSILNLKNNSFNSTILMNGQPVDISVLAQEFEQHLHSLLREIFSAATVFSQTEFPERCRICSFRDICRKG